MRRFALGAALVVAAAAASAQADVILTSWENTADGFSQITGYSTTLGVTNGTYGAIVPVTGWTGVQGVWTDAPFTGALAALQGNTTLAVDAAIVNPSPNGWENLSFGIRLNGTDANGVWTEITGPMDRYSPTGTATFNYASAGVFGASLAAGTAHAVQITVLLNTAGGWTGSDVVIDNLRIVSVPEPTSIALLGLVAGGLLRRRRA